MSTVLVLAGGSPHAHDFAAIGDALVDLAGAAGHAVERSDDPAAAADRLASDPPVDVLVIDGLWWRMDGDAYDEWRDEYAYRISPDTRDALAGHVRDGGGLVAMHTAPICFDDWPEWGHVLGGAWQWGTSSHPPRGPVEADIVADHPVVAGVGRSISIVDEVYGDLAMKGRVEVLATARRSPDDDEQPVVWAHRYGDGRVVFDGFGHDASSIRHADNARIIAQAITWVDPSRAAS